MSRGVALSITWRSLPRTRKSGSICWVSQILYDEPVTLSVGLEDGSAFDSVHEKDNPVTLTVISPVYGIVALLIIAATLVFLLWLARNTNIIREPGPPPAPGKRRPYNLGRAQMAFWFFLIYASYMTIWLITGALDTITASLLALDGYQRRHRTRRGHDR